MPGVEEIYSQQQLETLIKSGKVVVVDFYATWCGPCRAVAPAIESMAFQYPEAKFCKVDVDQQKAIAQGAGVSAMPTFKIFAGATLIDTVQGANAEAVRSAVERAFRLVPAAPTAPGGAKDTAVASTSEEALLVGLKTILTTTEGTQARYDAAHEILSHLRNNQSVPLGLGLLPLILADSCPGAALDAVFKSLLSPPPGTGEMDAMLGKHDVTTIVTNLLGLVTDKMSWMSETDTDGLNECFQVLRSILLTPTAVKEMAASQKFSGSGVKEDGRQMQTNTTLGVVSGMGLWDMRLGEHEEFMKLLDMFPLATGDDKKISPEAKENGKRRIESHIGRSHDRVFPFLRQLLGNASARPSTLQWLADYVRANHGYTKERPKRNQLATRFSIHTIANTLVSLAMPVINAKDYPASIPPHYVIDTSEYPVLGVPADTERIVAFDKEDNPMPTYTSQTQAYAPKVELFFLAAEAMHLAQGTILQSWDAWRNNVRHPEIDPRSRHLTSCIMALSSGLLTAKDIAVRSLQFYNGMARWLLHVANCDMTTGDLPDKPSEAWQSLPLYFVDDVIRSCTLITQFRVEIDYFVIMDIVSLLLALMGNLTYFPKPHVHAIFPQLLNLLTHHPAMNRHFQSHPFYKKHVLRRCVACYVVVGKAEHERTSARYYLSSSLREYLSDDILCSPIRATFEDANDDLLETFSHVVTSESSDALEGVLTTLVNMREAESEKTDEQLREDDDYKDKGDRLRNLLAIFDAAIDVFGSLATQFPKGVLRHLVAQQICVMLVKSLVKLAGRNSKELKLRNPSDYDFDARKMLNRVVECFAKFKGQEPFLTEVSKCGVSMDEYYYACDNISRRNLVAPNLAADLQQMAKQVQELSEANADEEAMWDDAPDFALCALLSAPLTDPVAIPPADGAELAVEDLTFCDKATIRHQLLTEPKNPFTRGPLTLEQLDTFNEDPKIKAHVADLLARIEAWKKEWKESH